MVRSQGDRVNPSQGSAARSVDVRPRLSGTKIGAGFPTVRGRGRFARA